jgi:hypothetical protein
MRVYTDAAEYILRCCEQMGFRLFIGHHQEELEHKGAVVRKPTTVVIAAAASDPSPSMIHSHYRNVVSEEDGRKWFGIPPAITKIEAVA